MRVLLTGATGFVGSHLLRGLLEDGHTVCVVKRSFSDPWRVEKLLLGCVVYDLDKTGTAKILEDTPVDCIVHCATHYVRDNREYQKNIDSNLLFPLELLGRAKEHGVKYFINTATFFEDQLDGRGDFNSAVYSHSYVLSKAQFAQWGELLALEGGPAFISLKLHHVYGGMDNGGKFIPYVLRQCRGNVPSLALSVGTQQRDFIHVSDVVAAYRAVISHLERHGAAGYRTYEVGTGRARSIKEFVGLIHRAVGSTTRLEWGALPMGKGELMYSRADNSALRELGWEPGIVEDAEIEKIFRGGVFRYRQINTMGYHRERWCA